MSQSTTSTSRWTGLCQCVYIPLTHYISHCVLQVKSKCSRIELWPWSHGRVQQPPQPPCPLCARLRPLTARLPFTTSAPGDPSVPFNNPRDLSYVELNIGHWRSLDLHNMHVPRSLHDHRQPQMSYYNLNVSTAFSSLSSTRWQLHLLRYRNSYARFIIERPCGFALALQCSLTGR